MPPELKIAHDRHPEPLPREREQGRDVVLVTGFHPFADESCNPSWDLCGLLPPRIDPQRTDEPADGGRGHESDEHTDERHRSHRRTVFLYASVVGD